MLDALAARVQTFEHWVYEQCLSTIDGFVPDHIYSTSYQLAYPLLDMQTVKTQLLPENVIKKMEGLLSESEKREEKERTEKEKERSAKEQALKALEEAKQKLRDAGLDD